MPSTVSGGAAPGSVSDQEPTPPVDVELMNLHTPASVKPASAPASSGLSAGASTSGPTLTIACKNASISFELDAAGPRAKNVLTPIMDIGRAIAGRTNKQRFYRLKNATGRVNPGSMTLILAPPGHGKSSLLRALAGWLPIDEKSSAADASAPSGVRYNGLSAADAAAQGINVRRLCTFVDQIDEHLPLMTVRETLDFAHQCTSAVQNPERVPAVIKMLGLEECENTILGNALVRGVSGGQKRRVTVGEMLVGDARALFLDEYTNGLDTATAEDITRGLRAWTRATNGSVVATAQQPTPGLFAQFDEIIIMGDSQILFHGPRADLMPFFASMGYACPSDVDVCDFVIDCVSQPHVALQRLQEPVERTSRAPVSGGSIPSLVPAAMLESTVGTLAVSAGGPCVDITAMVAHFRRSPFFEALERDTDVFFANTPVDVSAARKSLMPTPEAEVMYKTGFTQPVLTLFGMVLARQASTFLRNKDMIFPRVFQSILKGLMYGSIYYKISDSSFILRMAIFLMCVAQVAFGNLVELPMSVATARIILRQGAAGFYPSWVYVVSAMIMSLPMFFAECVLLGAIMYFMSDSYANAGAFFIFLAVLLAQSLLMAIWFRFATAITPDEASAQSIAGSSTGIFLLLGGFFVTMNAMPVWMRWLMWATPVSWSVRALANNEFLSARYPPAVGRAYLRALDFQIGHEWIGYAIIYCIGVTALLMVLHALFLRSPHYEGSRGTRRVEEDEVLESAAEIGAEVAFEVAEDAKEESRLSQTGAAEGGLEPSFASFSNNLSGSGSANASVLRTLREALPFSPVWLSFKDIHYTVQVKDSEGVVSDRPLLRGVSGFAEPGKLTALMGASGAGKTTLLDVLAGRKNTGKIEGEIKFNGRSVTPTEVADNTGYVEQFDSLFPFDTVRETLLFAAELRLPSSVPSMTKATIVDEVLNILELTSIRNLMIGSSIIPSLSPSQLKRVNIGCELVANPAVLFLDEPTTGLDSRSAQTVMRVVRRIARSGRSVICTIHQPSAELFYLFDRLVLLASGGHQVFFGGLGKRSRRFVPYLQSIDGVAPCPPRYNPASWMLEEMGVGQTSGKPEGIVGASRYDDSKAIIERFKSVWESSRQRASALQIITELDNTANRQPALANAVGSAHGAGSESDVSDPEPSDPEVAAAALSGAPAPDAVGAQLPRSRGKMGSRSQSFSHNTSVVAPLPTANAHVASREPVPWPKAFMLVLLRTVRGFWRNPPVIVARTIAATVVSLVIGLIYFDFSVSDQTTAVGLISVLSMGCMFGAINHAMTSLPNLAMNRVVMYRELSSNMYSAWMWGISNFLAESLFSIHSTFTSLIPLYFLAGLNSNAEIFFKTFIAFYVMILCYISMSCLISSAAPTLPLAGVYQGVYVGLFMMLAGVTAPLPQLPIGWVWLFRALPGSHATEALVMTQVGTCSPLPNCGPTITVLDGITPTTRFLAEFVETYLGFGFTGFSTSLAWLVLFIFVVQVLGVLALTFLNFSRR